MSHRGSIVSIVLIVAASLPGSAAEDVAIFERLVASTPAAHGAFWFAPSTWTSWDLRMADVGVSTFFPGEALAGALLEGSLEPGVDEPAGAAGVVKMQRHRLVPGPRASRSRPRAAARPSVGPIVRLLRAPRVRIRVTPGLAGITDSPARPPRPTARPQR
jgi:hypothetical protein